MSKLSKGHASFLGTVSLLRGPTLTEQPIRVERFKKLQKRRV